MDDLTAAILASHATTLESLAAGQETLALGLHAIAAVLDRQLTDGSALTDELRKLNEGIKRQQERIQQKVQESADNVARVRRSLGELQRR